MAEGRGKGMGMHIHPEAFTRTSAERGTASAPRGADASARNTICCAQARKRCVVSTWTRSSTITWRLVKKRRIQLVLFCNFHWCIFRCILSCGWSPSGQTTFSRHQTALLAPWADGHRCLSLFCKFFPEVRRLIFWGYGNRKSSYGLVLEEVEPLHPEMQTKAHQQPQHLLRPKAGATSSLAKKRSSVPVNAFIGFAALNLLRSRLQLSNSVLSSARIWWRFGRLGSFRARLAALAARTTFTACRRRCKKAPTRPRSFFFPAAVRTTVPREFRCPAKSTSACLGEI